MTEPFRNGRQARPEGFFFVVSQFGAQAPFFEVFQNGKTLSGNLRFLQTHYFLHGCL